MAGDSRDLRPRPRSHRPLLTADEGLREAIESTAGEYRVKPPVSSRLWQKSALGRTSTGGDVILTPSEVLFCHWHRNLMLPGNDFIRESLENDRRFIHEAIALESVRSGGEILAIHHTDSAHAESWIKDTWGMRWNRDGHPSSSPPLAQMRWFISSDTLDMHSIHEWVMGVEGAGQMAEIVVVDNEFDTTIYRLSIVEPAGSMRPPSELEAEDVEKITTAAETVLAIGEGGYISSNDWPLDNLGVRQLDGLSLDSTEMEWLSAWSRNEVMEDEVRILDDLLHRGLLARPGFKYGCRWRVYSESMSEVHAAWLMSVENETPRSWEEACLRARLAAGVNKEWVSILLKDGAISYLSMERIILGR